MTSRFTDTDEADDAWADFTSARDNLLEDVPEVLARFSGAEIHADVFLESTSRILHRRSLDRGIPRTDVDRRADFRAALNVVHGDDAFLDVFDPRRSGEVLEAANAAASMISADGPRPDVHLIAATSTNAFWNDRRSEGLLADVSDIIRDFDSLGAAQITLDRSQRRRFVVSAKGHATEDIRQSAHLIIDARIAASAPPRSVRTVIDVTDDDGLSVLDLQADLADQIADTADVRSVQPSQTTVIFPSGWPGMWIHEVIGHMLEADVFFGGPFCDQRGQMVAPTFMTITDGADVGGFDDEGHPIQTTTLIEDGRLAGLLTDQRAAHRHGLPASGNGFRSSARHAPMPRMSTIALQPGEGALADFQHQIRDAVVVTGFHSAKVTPAGDVSLQNCRGYRIENGRRMHAVRDLVLRANALDWLSNITLIGAEVAQASTTGLCIKAGQPHPVRVAAPTTVVTGIGLRQM